MPRFVMISLNDRGNLGARQIVAYAKKMDVPTILVNFGEYAHDRYEFSETIENMGTSWSQLKIILSSFRPTHIGISYRSAMAALAEQLAMNISISSTATIIAGGIGATSGPDGAEKWADVVCVGEGDKVLADALGINCYFGKRLNATLVSDLDTVPFPDYDGDTTWTIVRGQVTNPDGRLDNDKGCYPLLTSRGCPRACTYCHNSIVHKLYQGDPSPYCRQRSVENVLQEIAWAVRRWGVDRLSIYDDLFIANPAWAIEFCRRLHEVFTGEFWCMAHPKYIREDVVLALVFAGCEEICVGVQSGSQRILDRYGRGTTLDDIYAAAAILERFPVAVKIDIISAVPFETDEDIEATLTMLRRLPCPKASREHVDAMTLVHMPVATWHPGLSRLTIFPHSAIAEEVTEEQCRAMAGPKQDFIDGLYRAAFVERWHRLDLVKAFREWPEFVRFRDSRQWPASRGLTSDEHWAPMSAWLDERMKK